MLVTFSRQLCRKYINIRTYNSLGNDIRTAAPINQNYTKNYFGMLNMKLKYIMIQFI